IFYFTYIVCIVYLNVPASWTLYPCILPTAQQQHGSRIRQAPRPSRRVMSGQKRKKKEKKKRKRNQIHTGWDGWETLRLSLNFELELQLWGFGALGLGRLGAFLRTSLSLPL